MTDQQNPKTSEEKTYKTEWSVSFERLNQDIRDAVNRFIGVTQEGGVEALIKEAHLSDDGAGASRAKVRLDLAVGETTIKALDSISPNLIEADLLYVGEIHFKRDTTPLGERVISLSQTNPPNDWMKNIVGWANHARRLRWDIALSRNLPLDLDIRGGVGRSAFDLGSLTLSALHLSGGTGEIEMTMPAGVYSARIDCGVGQVNLTVKSGATVDLQIGGGTGEINLIIEDGAALSTRIRGGVGSVNVRVAPDASVKLNAKTGLGSVDVGSRIPRISGGKGDFFDRGGVWQTPGFEGAALPITIDYDGGVGSFSLR